MMVNTFLVKMDHDCEGVSCITYDDHHAEIARLRAELTTARNDALEDAARILEAWGDTYGANAAANVRTLKGPKR